MSDYKESLVAFLNSRGLSLTVQDIPSLKPLSLYESLESLHADIHIVIEEIFSLELKRYGYSEVLRGNDCMGYKLLSILWERRESNEFKTSILIPFLDEVKKQVMEGDEKLIINNRSEKRLYSLVSSLLNKLYTVDFLSEKLISTFKNINIQLCIKTTDTYPKIIGGLLILRLINPMIVFPSKCLNVEGISDAVSRVLVLVGKILQMVSNENNEKSLSLAWARKQQVTWGIFFHKKFELYNIYDKDKIFNSTINSKHTEIISFLFELDNSKDYDTVTLLNRNCTHYYKSIRGYEGRAVAMLSKTEFLIPAPPEEVFNWTVANTDNDKNILLENRIIRVINENLCVKYLKYDMFLPFITDRDILFLEYKEFFKGQGFGVICRISIEMDEMPHGDLVRGEVKGGFIFRENPKGTMITHIVCTAPGGKFHYVPDKVRKYLCIRESKRLCKMAKCF